MKRVADDYSAWSLQASMPAYKLQRPQAPPPAAVPVAAAELPMGQYKIRALFGDKHAALIIGKGGQVIKHIRESSKCSLEISDGVPGIDERVVAISGEQAGVCNAMDAIMDKVGEEEATKAAGDEYLLTYTLLVASSQCGVIIGKGGATLNDLQSTGATVNVQTAPLQGSNERRVTVSAEAGPSGDAEVCGVTVLAIANKLINERQITAPGPTFEYQPGAVKMAAVAAVVNFGNGSYGCGYGIGMGAAKAALPAATAGATTAGADASSAGSHLGPTILKVANSLVGGVIGKGGVSIREVRQGSGARVQISQSSADNPQAERVITITGQPEAVNTAVYMLNNLITMERTKQMGALAGMPGVAN